MTTFFSFLFMGSSLAALGFLIAMSRRRGARRWFFGSAALAAVSMIAFDASLTPAQQEAFAADRQQREADSRQAKIAAKCSDEGMFFVMSQKFVRQALKAPSTASFPSAPGQVVRTANCRYVVTAHVDAQNSFGATIRSIWGVDLEYLPASDQYQAHHVSVE